MHAEPQKEHQWLQKLVGEWTFEAECVTGPDQPPMRSAGTERVRSIGGLWTMGEGQGAMPGCGPATTLMTLGFDPRTGRFVGTFIASMMNHLWIYNGSLDAAGKILTLDTEGPDFSGAGPLQPYRDAIEFLDDDRRLLTSSMPDKDGTWKTFMTCTYRRVK